MDLMSQKQASVVPMKDIHVQVLRVAGVLLFQGLLAEPQMQGVLFGTNLDGTPREKEFVPREQVDALVARINELEGMKEPLQFVQADDSVAAPAAAAAVSVVTP
jgi:hypothetical protein